jgi:hypothetical protein
MTDPSPMLPALQRLNLEREMFTRLSEFQRSSIGVKPVRPSLDALLPAVLPALEAGFAYTASHWQGELTVTLHYQGAELGSSAAASLDCCSETTARLLAGLLGVPLRELEHASEPEQQDDPQTPAVAVEAAAPVAAPEVAPPAEDLEEEEEFDDDLEPSEDVTRSLSDAEKSTAVEMVKVLPTEQRRAFTKAFREVFEVPAESKQIVPFITELRHLQFIDRFTVEASGGIAA